MNDHGVSLDAVLDYELPEAEIISRLSGRRASAKNARRSSTSSMQAAALKGFATTAAAR